MKMYFKKILLIGLLGTPLLITPIVSASSGIILNESETVKQEVIVNEPSAAFKPGIADAGDGGYKYGKTIDVYYTSLNQIPYNYYYSEYSNEYNTWMKGNLVRTSITQINANRYRVIFQGTLTS